MEYIKIGNQEFKATIFGKTINANSEKRAIKTVTVFDMSYEDVKRLFFDGVKWSIISEFTTTDYVPALDEKGKPIYDLEGNVVFEPKENIVREEFDNSEYTMVGDITLHRDGSTSIEMGKLTDMEQFIEELYGGIK